MTYYAGVTRDSDSLKLVFSSPTIGPALIILDANLAVTTPLNVWIQTGVRAIDHCVESFCNLKRVAGFDEACVKGLQRLIPALLLCKADPSNAKNATRLSTRHPGRHDAFTQRRRPRCQSRSGHRLGPLGVGHGITSCILLPAVCKWNAKQKANVERQKLMEKILWDIDAAREFFEARGLKKGEADLEDLIDAIVREKFEDLAVNALEDNCTQANPARIYKQEQVLEILEMCA
ncbi:hypothetical protein HO173_012207 [Letharia columbiana]|uniref:Fe-containing alcohol dehydrogenase-like C-terminal domain-containing protein n=1 Tax=Letharia columbiana TaxID=112416 RepID=A0A8H6FH12_9LECA|nr:uncharacterized protein HO173_012207 [Letharia columbiana]KAF6227568.1 hypothetical protein HO173_012207 [Letharia columbiana]